MVESGGSGRPRPDDEHAAEHPVTPAPAATDVARTPDPGPPGPATPASPDQGGTPPTAPTADPSTPAADGPRAESAAGTGPEPEPEPESEPGTESRPPTGGTRRPDTDPDAGPGHTPAGPGEAPAGSDDGPSVSGDAPPHADTAPGAATPPAPRDEAPGGTDPEAGEPTAPSRTPAATPASDPASGPAPIPTLPKGPPPQRPPEQPRGGLLMGRPFGVPVYVAPSWFLVAALITWVFGNQLDRVLPELGAARYLVALFFAVAFYASVLVHELAHTIAALRFALPVRRIQLQFFGGVSEIEKEAETPGREFWLAFVGPLLSLVLAGVFYLAMQPVERGTVPGVLLAGLMISNLIVAIFNLLPGLPLDGGRMLRAVVWKITGKPMSGTVAAAWVGRALAVSVLIGLPLLTQSGALGTSAEDSVGMDTVTDALLAAILAAIIWTGAGNSLRMARLREHLPELRARTLTRRAVPVETHTPLSEALRRANDAGARALVVVDANGEPLSLVREAAIVGVPEHRRPWVAVSGLAQDLSDGMRVSAELAGEDLLDVLRATPATEYLVVEETGEIFGVLSAADVERAFVKAMARPS
ncbi:site-2 protease family protein [Streptomyces asoensis]|uniref:site-2 protease family protein n=1 Tax=Streptomyces asoensis TaxID=249586 RepID=UPI0033E7A1D8